MISLTFILSFFFFLILSFSSLITSTFNNQTLSHQHPFPESVVQQVNRRINESISRRQISDTTVINYQCLTGNPIDDCWRCDPNWVDNRQQLADCAIGFGHGAVGGKGGRYYLVSDPSDYDTVNPTPGTLRHAVIQDEPLWITFAGDMIIRLKHELMINNYKTIDGRGANVHVTGGGCITLQYVTNVIIHNIHVYNCIPSGNSNIRQSTTQVGWRGMSDGDGISIYSSRNIWIDHCALSHCTDGLIDAIMGSTAITISNSYFTHHDKVMLLGHDDRYVPDVGMQVTIAFNHFGEGLVQRMPRCRRGYIHVVNNDFTEWQMYAIGGSANPTINSQGNRFTAPEDPNAKEVTKRVDVDERDWTEWNWRTEGDEMVNGAYFVPSGDGISNQYALASSMEPKSAFLIEQLTMNAGVIGVPRDTTVAMSFGGRTRTTIAANRSSSVRPSRSNDGDDGFLEKVFGSVASAGSSTSSPSSSTITILFSLLILYIITNNIGLL